MFSSLLDLTTLLQIAVALVVLRIVQHFWTWHDMDPLKLKPTEFPQIAKEMPKASTEEKICVVGAGFSGLAVGGAFVRYGIPFDQYEGDDHIGGNWYHGVYETVHIISSRNTTEFKDFPMPSTYPEFPSATQMLEYLVSYADHYNLRKYIQFNTKIANVKPIQDGKQWEVELASGEKRIYKGVVIANGHHWDCRMPQYPGTFTGEMIHSKDYKKPEMLKGKRVLVVGGGNSACDIAVEAARFGETSHISMRRGYWFLPRTLVGVPMVELIRPWMPLRFQRLLLRVLLKVIVGDYSKYGLQQPDHEIFDHHPTINSELLHYLKLGSIHAHVDIKQFDGKVVEFADGKKEEFDTIICATGFKVGLPMVSQEIIPYKDGIPQLYGFSSDKFKNLYVFGVGQVRYGAGPMYTMTADLLSRVINIQEKLKRPFGGLSKFLGASPLRKSRKSADVLLDPHASMRAVLKSRVFVAHAATIEAVGDKFGRTAAAWLAYFIMTFLPN